jgi:predicted ArsR family transcriptional regulator
MAYMKRWEANHRKILEAKAGGLETKQIAALVRCSTETVRKHLAQQDRLDAIEYKSLHHGSKGGRKSVEGGVNDGRY